MRIAITLVLALAFGSPVLAFHDGGVARCDGCHVTHDGVPVADGQLLISESPSDVCLVCHASSFGAVLGTDPLAPPPERGAGNFVFLLEENLNDAADGVANPILGDAAGHNVDAPGHGLFPDRRHGTAPGGSFPANRLGCTSCHDPHGNSNFRMLFGATEVQGGIARFGNPAMDAQGISLSGVETRTNHSAYRAGVSEWCANCHGRYHDDGFSDFEHPSGEVLESEISSRYNVYDGDANPSGGTSASAYLPEVPIEDGSSAINSTNGASSISRVMCLSCHRAHASSAPAAGRWDFNVSLLSEDGVVSLSYPIPDPYNDSGQGTLCAKCHVGGAPAVQNSPADELLRLIDRSRAPSGVRGGRLVPR